jgi:hypothetical protein
MDKKPRREGKETRCHGGQERRDSQKWGEDSWVECCRCDRQDHCREVALDKGNASWGRPGTEKQLKRTEETDKLTQTPDNFNAHNHDIRERFLLHRRIRKWGLKTSRSGRAGGGF